jgi:hypothetical protein
MALNIGDAEDSYLKGSLDFDEWLEEFERQWYEPLGRTMLATLLQSLPPEVAAQLQARNPQAFEEMAQMIMRPGRV